MDVPGRVGGFLTRWDRGDSVIPNDPHDDALLIDRREAARLLSISVAAATRGTCCFVALLPVMRFRHQWKLARICENESQRSHATASTVQP